MAKDLNILAARSTLDDLQTIIKSPGNWKTRAEFEGAVFAHIFVVLENLVEAAESRENLTRF